MLAIWAPKMRTVADAFGPALMVPVITLEQVVDVIGDATGPIARSLSISAPAAWTAVACVLDLPKRCNHFLRGRRPPDFLVQVPLGLSFS